MSQWSGLDLNRNVAVDDYTATDMPEYPARTLVTHVIVKGIQAGSIVGLIATPAVMYYRKRHFVQSWRLSTASGTSIGIIGAIGLLYNGVVSGKLTIEGVDDRAYRISHNKGQNTVDKYSIIGGLIGATVLGIGTGKVANVLPGTFTGFAVGTIYYAVQPIVAKLINDK